MGGGAGAVGQFKLEGPYSDVTPAIKSFEKKFKDKTKNDWANRSARSRCSDLHVKKKLLNASNTVANATAAQERRCGTNSTRCQIEKEGIRPPRQRQFRKG